MLFWWCTVDRRATRGSTAAASRRMPCSPRSSSPPCAHRRTQRTAAGVRTTASGSVASRTASTCSTGRSSCGCRRPGPVCPSPRCSRCASRPRSRSHGVVPLRRGTDPAGRFLPKRLATRAHTGRGVRPRRRRLFAVTASPPPRAFVLAPLASQPSSSARGPHRGDLPGRSDACAPHAVGRDVPSPLETDRPLRVLVVGDSVGITLGRGLELWSRETGRPSCATKPGSTAVSGATSRASRATGPTSRAPGATTGRRGGARDVDDFDPDVVVVLYTIWELDVAGASGRD